MVGNHALEYVLEELKHIRADMADWQKAEDILEMIQKVNDRVDDIDFSVSRIQERLDKIESLDAFLKKLDLMETQMNDRQEKLTENTQRVNEMTLELKGVVAQARSCVNERKDFVRNLGAALQELT